MPSDSLSAAICSLVATYVVHSTLFLLAAWVLLSRCRSHAWTCRGWRMAAVLGVMTAPLQVATGLSPITWRVGTTTEAPASASAHRISEAAGGAIGSPSVTFPIAPEPVAEIEPTSIGVDPGAEVPIVVSIPNPEEPTVHEFPGIKRSWEVERGPDFSADPVAVHTTVPSPEPVVAEEPILAEVPVITSRPESDRSQPHAFGLSVGAVVLLGCVALGLLRLTVLAVRMWRWSRGGTPLRSAAARRMLDRLRTARGIRRTVELVERDDLESPAACGGWRWRILLPSGLAKQTTPASLEAVLAHELAHLVRRDGIWLWIGQVLRWCLAFQPLNRLAVERWRRSSEFACDEWAVAGGIRPTTLARCLADLATLRDRVPDPPAVVASAVSARSVLVERVESLLAVPPRPTARRRAVLPLLCGVTLISAAPFAPAVRFVWADGGTTPPVEFVEPLDDALSSVEANNPPDDGGNAEPFLFAEPGSADWAALDRELRSLDGELERLERRAADHPLPELRQLAEDLARRRAEIDRRRHTIDARLSHEPHPTPRDGANR